MLRIAHVTDNYLPRLGGIETHVHDLTGYQRAAGHHVDVLTIIPESADVAPASGPDPVTDSAAGGRIIRFPTRTPIGVMRAGNRLFDPRHLAPGMLEQYDIVHVHISMISPFGATAASSASRAGLPTVITVHSMWPAPGFRWADLAVGHRRWPVVWSAVSEAAAEPIRRALGPGRSVRVLPNAVDTSAWQLPESPRPDGDVTIVTAMRLAPRKRPMPLLSMLRRVHRAAPSGIRVRAVLVGDGPQRPAMERYIDRHHMADWVELPGRVARDDVRRILGRSDVYVSPARLESFGIAALEARCAGLPVVGYASSGVSEFVTHGRDGLLASSDAEIVRALSLLVARPDLRLAVHHHNRMTLPPFSWQEALVRTHDAYAEARLQAGVITMPEVSSSQVGTP
ncbi:MAG: glycosyltransferase family 4 protein [Nocardioidaceae bacterium]